jgi:raffinose/stachyose/melibiose transport system permease protein
VNRDQVPIISGEPRLGRKRLGVRHVPWLIAIPGIVLSLALRYLPSALGAAYSFTDWKGLTMSANPVGFSNYISIFIDPITRSSVFHTLLIAVLMVVFANVIGLALALVLRSKFKLRNLWRALFFLPFALTRLATGYVWQYILSYEGPLNQFLTIIGLEKLKRIWLADPQYAIYMIAVVLVWQYIGFAMIIYLSGLEGIPEELDDAVAVDGASKWLKFRRVTLPLLAPSTTVAFLLTMVWGLSSFDQIIALTGGGPAGVTETLATMIWKTSFTYGLFGKGSAFAIILTIVVAFFSILQNVILRRREEML